MFSYIIVIVYQAAVLEHDAANQMRRGIELEYQQAILSGISIFITLQF